MLSISKTVTAKSAWHRPTLERRAAFVRGMRDFGDQYLFPVMAITACVLVQITILIPVIVKYL